MMRIRTFLAMGGAALAAAVSLPVTAVAQSTNQWAPNPAPIQAPQPPAPSGQGNPVWGDPAQAGAVYAPADLDERLDTGQGGQTAVVQVAPVAAPAAPVVQVPQAPQALAAPQIVQQPVAPVQPAQPGGQAIYAPAQTAQPYVPAQTVQPYVPAQTVLGAPALTILPGTGLNGWPTSGYGGYGYPYGAGYGYPYGAGYGYPASGYGYPATGSGLGLPFYGWDVPSSTMMPFGSTDYTPGLVWGTNPYSPVNSLGGSPFFGGTPFGF